MTFQEEGQIQIHTENIFPIIKKAVYSDHEIFLRELISNGVDAINKRRMVSIAGDCEEGNEGKIDIKINREEKTLTISDNGIGMNADEIKKYINQVAFSSAEEFLKKYKQDNDSFIGHFGLGFYSSFMVAKNVEIITKSAKRDSICFKWSCDGSPNFTIKESKRDNAGTDVILYLLEEELEYLEPSRIRTLITKYCDFMPLDISLEGEVINKKNPEWRKSPRELSDNDYIELYKYLYPFQGDPLLWIHLNTDYPYNLQGILYFPKTSGRADWEQGQIKLYCNQVFVSDSIKEVVPRYLLPLRGVIDSPDIPLNVSRSALQTDRRVRSIGNFIAKKVSDRLKTLKTEDPNFYAEVWNSLAPFVKIGAMEDEKFADQVEEIILFPTKNIDEQGNNNDLFKSNEDIYTTIDGYKSRIKDESSKKILYFTDEIGQASALKLWTEQGIEVIKADSVIDSQFIPWLEERHEDYSFLRVDSELDESLSQEQSNLTDKDGETSSDSLNLFLKKALDNEKITVKVQALKGEQTPPAMILLPEQIRRINDIGALMEQKIPGLPENHVLLININHPLIQNLMKLKASSIITGSNESSPNEVLAQDLARHIYNLAKLGVGGLNPQEIADFQIKSSDLMGRLLTKME